MYAHSFLFQLLVFSLCALPAFAQEVPELEVTLTEHLVIGDDESAPLEYLFSGPRNMAVDREGNIYVADARSADVRIFSSEGEHVRTLGRRGQALAKLRTPILGIPVTTNKAYPSCRT